MTRIRDAQEARQKFGLPEHIIAQIFNKTASPTRAQRQLAQAYQAATPQQQLYAAIEKLWPGRTRYNLKGVIPNRRLEIDIAFPDIKLPLEINGIWAHSQRANVARDLEKAQLLRELGWYPMVYYEAMLIVKDLPRVMADVHVQVQKAEILSLSI